ncbi:MAG: ribonuclease Z [Actinomycetota bacterium]|nr:ribonuclease Z [Actinomycetota bacterium]MDQ3648058.1 ribonuclease Z [Actinomycetota bacterium]
MDLDVLFVGTAGSAPSARRSLPATLVRRGGDRLLFDCGEGTQRQLTRSIGLVELDDVFLTHFHADHVLGLPGLIKTFSLRGRERPLTVHGPPGLTRLFRAFAPLIGRTGFELCLVELEHGEELRRDGYRIAAFDVDHGVRARGYALVEDARPGRFDEARARELGVEPGPDFGRLQRGEAVGGVAPREVLGPERPGRKVVVTGDTAPSQLVVAVAHRADLLVHEATFMAEDAGRAAETHHSTAGQAGALAAEAEVGMLALTHLSARYPVREVRDEARAAFDATVVPDDFDRVELPLPERGGPVHHRAQAPDPSS